MNHTEDLRRALRSHASEVHDPGHVTRSHAVRRRVRVVRRRRRAGLAGAAAAVVVMALAVPSVLPDTVAPADAPPSQLAGRAVPATQTSTGFTYTYAEGYESEPGATSLQVGVKVGDRPRLVMWAASPDGSDRPHLRLTTDGNLADAQVALSGEFGRFRLLGAGPQERPTRSYTHTVRLTELDEPGDRRLAIAVYDLVETPPEGVSNGTTTFRQQVLDETLLAARIGEPGQSEVSFEVSLPGPEVAIADTCYGTDAMVYVSVDGSLLFGSGCPTRPEVDPGGVPGFALDGTRPVEGMGADATVRIRAWLAEPGKPDRVAQDTDAVLGVGVYTASGPSSVVAGVPMPQRVEHGGHEYAEVNAYESEPGARLARSEVGPRARPMLVEWHASGLETGGAISLLVDGKLAARSADYGRSGSAIGSAYVLQPGDARAFEVRVDRGLTAETSLGIRLSEQVH